MEVPPSTDVTLDAGSSVQSKATGHVLKPNLKRYRLALVLTIAGMLLFAVGIFAPSMTITPSMGGRWFNWLFSRFRSLTPYTYSIASGLWELLKGGEILLAVIIFLFSIVFPLLKLLALLGSIYQGSTGHPHPPALAWMSRLGKWSMLDVFVVGVIVVSYKSFPGGTRIEPNWGLFVFACSVILSMLATAAVKADLPPPADA